MTEGWGCEGQKMKERKQRGSCLEAGDYEDRWLGKGSEAASDNALVLSIALPSGACPASARNRCI